MSDLPWWCDVALTPELAGSLVEVGSAEVVWRGRGLVLRRWAA